MLPFKITRIKWLIFLPVAFVVFIILTMFLAPGVFGVVLFSPLFAYNYINEKVIHRPLAGNTFYYRGLDGVYYNSTTGCLDICFSKSFKKLEGADLRSFQIFGGKNGTPSDYAKDKYKVYIRGKVINSADPETFSILLSAKSIEEGTEKSKTIYQRDVYAYDKNNKFKSGKIIDPSDLQELSRFEDIKSYSKTITL